MRKAQTPLAASTSEVAEELRRLLRNPAFALAHEVRVTNLPPDGPFRQTPSRAVLEIAEHITKDLPRHLWHLSEWMPISIAEAQTRWPSPPPEPAPRALSLEERLSRIEHVLRASGTLPA